MIDRKLMNELKADINKALEEVAKKHNVELKIGNGSYSELTADFKLNVNAIVDGEVVSKIAEDFKNNAMRFGLEAEDLGIQFDYMGKTLVLIGCKPRNRKYPLIAQDAHDETIQYKLSSDVTEYIRLAKAS